MIFDMFRNIIKSSCCHYLSHCRYILYSIFITFHWVMVASSYLGGFSVTSSYLGGKSWLALSLAADSTVLTDEAGLGRPMTTKTTCMCLQADMTMRSMRRRRICERLNGSSKTC